MSPSEPNDRDGIPGGRPRTAQAVTVALLIVGLLLAIFVVQNTGEAEIRFLGWSANSPLAGALLLAAVLGGILAGLVVYIRQRQFRKALKASRRKADDEARARSTMDRRQRDDVAQPPSRTAGDSHSVEE